MVMRRVLSELKAKVKDPVFDSIFKVLMNISGPHPGRAPFDYRELRLLFEALRSQNLCCVDGQMVPAFEREFAVAYGVPYAVASTSGTAAIHVALGALDLNPGDEVITAPITDMGTIIPILYQNAIPVFADISDTYNMDPQDVERKITPYTRAIIVVHLFGNPCNMDAMLDIARRHRIPLIEDCAQAHMTEYQGKYVGTLGDIGCFSFQQSKHMTTGDGGMTITSNKAYYERMKLFADKGYARKGWGARAYAFHAPNYRMTELVGAVGRAQLKKVKSVVKKRNEMGEYMTQRLSGLDGVSPAPVTAGAKHAYWLYPLRVDGVDINLLCKEMIKEKVWASAGYIGKPIYLCSESLTAKKTYGDSQWPFTYRSPEKAYDYREGLCPKAEKALERLVCIPWDESWEKRDVEHAAKTLSACIDRLTSKSVSATPRPIHHRAPSPVISETGEGKKLRIGIVGCGQMGRWHLDAYKKMTSCQLVAFADSDLSKARQFATEMQARPYSSHGDMIRQESLHGISICTVPSTHFAIAIDALNQGIHVLCEKPLAVSVDEAHEMFDTARLKNLLLLPAFKFRFFEEVSKAKELIEKGSLGKILTFRIMFGGHMDNRGTWYARRELSGGGVIIDNGSHAFDLARYLFGEIRSVLAQTSNRQNLDVEDTANLNILTEQGTVGTIDLSWSLAVPSQAYLEIYGEDGTALLDLNGITYRFHSWSDWKRIPNTSDLKEGFARQISHFLDSISSQQPSILENTDGLENQTLIDAAYESLRRQERIVQKGVRETTEVVASS